jgi:hypothetical protein
MTELQIGLVLIGVLAVVAVVVYNWLQERRARRAAERAFGGRHSDVLLDEPHARREPTLGLPPRSGAAGGATAPDPRIDYIILLSPPSPIAAPVLRELWGPIQLRFAGRAFVSQEEAGRVCAALQLVTRAGVVSDAELLEFRSAVETLAAKVRAAVAAPEMREALEAARELDRACADADIQVALHVVGISSLPRLEGEFRVEERAGGVTLTLDVPRTPEPQRVYESMARAGLQLAAAQGGRVVDDNGAALDERALAAIGAELEAVRQALRGRGIEPGGPLALRLFS